MAFRGTDPESYITEYTLVYEDKTVYVGPCVRFTASPSQTKYLDDDLSKVIPPTNPSTYCSLFLVLKLGRRVCE